MSNKYDKRDFINRAYKVLDKHLPKIGEPHSDYDELMSLNVVEAMIEYSRDESIRSEKKYTYLDMLMFGQHCSETKLKIASILDIQSLLTEFGTELDKVNTQREKTAKFKEEYRDKHVACPKCGEVSHTTTLMAFMVHPDNIEAYKDLNDCICSNCKDKHTVHDRVQIKNN